MLYVLSAIHGYTLPARPAAPMARCSLPVMADGSPYKVGVLAIQGGFAEHVDALERQSGVEALEVRTIADLQEVDAIILPGGESTAIGHGLVDASLLEPLRDFAKEKPVFEGR